MKKKKKIMKHSNRRLDDNLSCPFLQPAAHWAAIQRGLEQRRAGTEAVKMLLITKPKSLAARLWATCRVLGKKILWWALGDVLMLFVGWWTIKTWQPRLSSPWALLHLQGMMSRQFPSEVSGACFLQDPVIIIFFLPWKTFSWCTSNAM